MLRVLAPLLILASVLAKPEQTLVSLIKRYKDVASLGPHLGDKAAMVNEAEDGRLPLVVAVQQDNKAAVSLLLQYGASLSQSEGRAGHSAMSAALTGNTSDDIVRLLLQYGPDLDMQYNGKSLRTYAKPKAQKLIAQYDDHGAAAFEDAPGTWQKHHNKDGVAYYTNAATQEAQYSKPTSCAWTQSTLEGYPVFVNSITHQRKWMRPQALAWKYLHSLEQDLYYWFNFATGTTVAHVPGELPDDIAMDLQYDSGSYYHNTATGASQWSNPDEADWRKVTDPEGNPFWFHPQTLERMWERPECHAWRAVPSKEHDNRLFWFNDVTSKAVWDKPEALAWEKQVYVHNAASGL